MRLPSTPCCSNFCGRRVFFGVADFFFAKRLFFRNGEGGEWRAWRATVGVKAKDNGGACFTLDFDITPTKGRQPSHPHRNGFFYSFHATCAPTPIYRNLEFVTLVGRWVMQSFA